MTEKKVLFVDNEEAILKLYRRHFEKRGYTVRTAGSGEAALALLRAEAIPVMFFDIMMPEMNGIDLFKKAIRLQPEARIYALTGFPTQFEHQGCLHLGFKGYFIKPVEMDDLVEAARTAYEAPKGGGE
jgi:DNA-binding NtrC family response regulator